MRNLLAQRLRTLARQAGGNAPPQESVADPLLARLRKSQSRRPVNGVMLEANGNSDVTLALAVKGDVAFPGVIRVERDITDKLTSRTYEQSAAEAADTLLVRNREGSSPWFLDTETTGLAGGTGTLAFMVGLARWGGGVLQLRQYLLSRFIGETHMLQAVTEDLGQRPTLITYNGKSFDGPLLSARSRLARRRDPLDEADHLDLLPLTRRAFSASWPDCRLATVEHKLLSVRRIDDLPGWAAPEAWLDWVRRGRTKNLVRVLSHNHQDLVSLADLLPILADVYSGVGHAQADPLRVAAWISRHHGALRAHRHLSKHRERLGPDGQAELARLARQSGDISEAVKLWRKLALMGRGDALENLAKFAEHKCQDHKQALALTLQLIQLQGEQAPHRKRLQRLQRKIRRTSCS